MTHLSSTTRLFVGLLIAILLLTYIALTLARQQKNNTYNFGIGTNNSQASSNQSLLDTSDWEEYQDRAYPLAFSYPKNWKVSTDTKSIDGFYSVVIDPDKSVKNIHIYISDKGFLALDGLSQEPYALSSFEGVKVDESLFGLKAGDYYYTFDASMNPKQAKEFATIVSTVEFK